MSLVIYDPGETIRRLPTLYLGPEPIFVDRDVPAVVAALGDWVAAIARADQESIYGMSGATYRGAQGLFAHELLNRSSFRRRLERAGVRIDPSPLVTFEEGRFVASDGPLRLDFIILTGEGISPGVPEFTRGAMLPFALVTRRLGKVPARELSQLVQACDGVPAFASAEPETVIATLDSITE